MHVKVAAFAAVVTTACCLWQPVLAAGRPESCVAIANDERRLACYDDALGRVSTMPLSAAPASEASLASTDVASVQARAEFGLSPQMRQERGQKTELESITATIVKVTRNASDRMVFTLDNGQVWLQTETQPRLRAKPGDTIKIRRALMGSYLLVTARSGATRARRIQ